ncbi:STAS domain-containing protein [Streptomyces sp. NPDC096339]|uniref:STAS domain-containing protein n=1 Tax=Streptomyces sp. NPDC096339 TaxID=3366086 RepID=UPI0037F5EA4D
MDFSLHVEHLSEEATLVVVSGELDVYAAAPFRNTVVDLIQLGHCRLVLDLDGVDFLDSTNLGVVVTSLKRTWDRGGGVALVITNPHMMKHFTLTGLTRVFTIHDTVAQALEALAREAWGVGRPRSL